MGAFLGQVMLRNRAEPFLLGSRYRLGQLSCCVVNNADGSQTQRCFDTGGGTCNLTWISPSGTYPGVEACVGPNQEPKSCVQAPIQECPPGQVRQPDGSCAPPPPGNGVGTGPCPPTGIWAARIPVGSDCCTPYRYQRDANGVCVQARDCYPLDGSPSRLETIPVDDDSLCDGGEGVITEQCPPDRPLGTPLADGGLSCCTRPTYRRDPQGNCVQEYNCVNMETGSRSAVGPGAADELGEPGGYGECPVGTTLGPEGNCIDETGRDVACPAGYAYTGPGGTCEPVGPPPDEEPPPDYYDEEPCPEGEVRYPDGTCGVPEAAPPPTAPGVPGIPPGVPGPGIPTGIPGAPPGIPPGPLPTAPFGGMRPAAGPIPAAAPQPFRPG